MRAPAASPHRPGRPRATGERASTGLSAREQILDAAAALFVKAGYSGTSTRAIAERVGIRQQSLYYHFAGKDEILAELLSSSVRPSNALVRDIERRIPHGLGPAAALYSLAHHDAGTLRRTPHNVGLLYLQPELQDERFDAFRYERAELRAAYGRIGVAAAHPEVISELDERQLGAVLIQIAELVIQLRVEGVDGSSDDAVIATSCLRLVGLTPLEIERARREAADNGLLLL